MTEHRKNRLIAIHSAACLLILAALLAVFYGTKAYYTRDPEPRYAISQDCMWTRLERSNLPDEYALIYTRDTWWLVNNMLDATEGVSPAESISGDWVYRIMLSDVSDGSQSETYEIFVCPDGFSITKGGLYSKEKEYTEYYSFNSSEAFDVYLQALDSEYKRYGRGFVFSRKD